MKAKGFIAKAETVIDATVEKVWNALVNPALIKRYMFGATIISDWKEGSKIIWKGEWEGKPFEDKGVILAFQPKKKLRYSHYSPLSGVEDIPENYHIVTVGLTEMGKQTRISLEQDNNTTEKEKEHSEQNWKM